MSNYFEQLLHPLENRTGKIEILISRQKGKISKDREMRIIDRNSFFFMLIPNPLRDDIWIFRKVVESGDELCWLNFYFWKSIILSYFSQLSGGKGQIINLGAGFDTLYWRLKDAGNAPVNFIELDFPNITAKKCYHIKKHKQLIDRLNTEGKRFLNTWNLKFDLSGNPAVWCWKVYCKKISHKSFGVLYIVIYLKYVGFFDNFMNFFVFFHNNCEWKLYTMTNVDDFLTCLS